MTVGEGGRTIDSEVEPGFLVQWGYRQQGRLEAGLCLMYVEHVMCLFWKQET